MALLATTVSDFFHFPYTFVSELFNFALILYGLNRWVVPWIRGEMDKKQAEIRSDLEEAAAGHELLEAAESYRSELLAQAARDAEAIRAQAERVAHAARDEILAHAAEEAARIRHRAALEAARESEQAMDQVRARFATEVLGAAEAIVVAELTPERNRALVDEAIAAIEGGAGRDDLATTSS